MKKTIVWMLVLTIFSTAAKAQLANSKWNGTLKLENDVNVSFDFKKDTVVVYNLADNSVIETMTFTATNSTLTLVKTSGQSDCDTAAGKYKFETKDNTLALTLVEDPCDDRSNVLKNLQLTKSTR